MFKKSFGFAWAGICQTLRTQRNFRIMLCIFLLVVAAGFLFRITPVEWAVLLLCCGSVLSLEMVNTALEAAVDLTTCEIHPTAKKAKDIAAGAVLVFSFFSVCVGLVIFVPHIIVLVS